MQKVLTPELDVKSLEVQKMDTVLQSEMKENSKPIFKTLIEIVYTKNEKLLTGDEVKKRIQSEISEKQSFDSFLTADVYVAPDLAGSANSALL